MDVVEASAVDMLVGEIIQEVAERRDAEFRFQQLGALWAYAGQIGDRSGEVYDSDRLLGSRGSVRRHKSTKKIRKTPFFVGIFRKEWYTCMT